MARFPENITAENVQNAALCVSAYEAHIKAKKLCKKILKPLGSFIFCLMSLLLVFGAIYSTSAPEDMVVFEKLGFMVDAWSKLSAPLTKLGLSWYVFWPVMILIAYAIPLLISALISILISLFAGAPKANMEGETPAQQAKNLYDRASAASKSASNYDNGSGKKGFKLLFVGMIAALLVYAFYVLKMFEVLHVKTLIGFAVVMVILYFVYGLLFNVFYALNSLFYQKKRAPYNISSLETYWLSVDPSEVQRRKAEAQRKEKEKEAAKAKQASPSRSSTASYTSSSSINEYDSFTWTSSYVRNNENKCSDVLLTLIKVSKDLLAEGDYSGAAAGFDKVVRGLELLCEFWPDYYGAPLFANCFALSKIFAFGLYNKDSALKYAQKACDYAARCNTEKAQRDLRVMRDYRDVLSESDSLSDFFEEFECDFPYEIISMN